MKNHVPGCTGHDPGCEQLAGTSDCSCSCTCPDEPTAFDLFMKELKSEGIAFARVDDGTMLIMSRNVLTELYETLQKDPTRTHVSLLIQDRALIQAARAAKRN